MLSFPPALCKGRESQPPARFRRTCELNILHGSLECVPAPPPLARGDLSYRVHPKQAAIRLTEPGQTPHHLSKYATTPHRPRVCSICRLGPLRAATYLSRRDPKEAPSHNLTLACPTGVTPNLMNARRFGGFVLHTTLE